MKAGIPAEKLDPHVAAAAPIEVMNAPIWSARNKYSRPGRKTYPIEVLAQGFQSIYSIYDELKRHDNPPLGGRGGEHGHARICGGLGNLPGLAL